MVAQWANRLGTSGGTVFPSIGDAFVEQNPPRGSGLQAFSRHGDLLYHLYGDEAIALTVIGQRLYVRRPGRVEVLALRSGDRLRTIPFRGERGHQLFPAFGRAG